MPGQLRNILVLGATGVIGRFIIKALATAAPTSFDRVAIFTSQNTIDTKTEQIRWLKDHGVEIIIGDLTDEAHVRAAYQGFDTIISCLGRNMIAAQIELIRIAESCPNIIRFFPSEYGTDIEYGPQSAHEKPHQLKLQVRRYIRDEVKRLEHTYLVTGPYADLFLGRNDAVPRAGTFDVVNKKAVLLDDGDGRISLTTMEDVGKLLVAAVINNEASRNQALKVNSFTTTPNEILAEFERQTQAKWEREYTSLPELRQLEQESWAAGHPLAVVATLRRIWTEGGTLYDTTDNEKIHAPHMDTLQMAVAGAVKAQQT
ncbi:aromatic alcohol reductase [Aspergillus clavatus NRRL 1]|uniref:Isoflavone reductase family protein n=1 Tax=Aspergillus clavatus (strain ATCC 1007 / CBS 513.65 / DSM 816 / NCTC 3887 / NRRL 1 / QM 1276 / 107) TaxID=344612 RepID=A1CPK8_ASPCL|nr:isoflavone reductase family protein [Aspergillus clavatus NRRL 1]EAW07579.1 isoflavone reductase family protein [Aspergillus clavatus NRRL 1]